MSSDAPDEPDEEVLSAIVTISALVAVVFLTNGIDALLTAAEILVEPMRVLGEGMFAMTRAVFLGAEVTTGAPTGAEDPSVFEGIPAPFQLLGGIMVSWWFFRLFSTSLRPPLIPDLEVTAVDDAEPISDTADDGDDQKPDEPEVDPLEQIHERYAAGELAEHELEAELESELLAQADWYDPEPDDVQEDSDDDGPRVVHQPVKKPDIGGINRHTEKNDE